MAILNNNPLVGASGNQGGYNINNSVRLRSSASAYLSRTYSGSPTSTTKQTFSFWVKRGALSAAHTLFGGYDGSSGNPFEMDFESSNVFAFYFGGAAANNITTTQVFRDTSAWYHIVVAVDTTQATSTNRVKIYINGTQITAFGTANYPAQNANMQFGLANANNKIGSWYSPTNYFDGYLAEVNFIDGQAKVASDFGETDTTTGVWKPKAYTGTYGTNGFYLKFSDIATTSGSNAGLGKDFSGNSNYWTTNNISVTAGTTYDAMTDSPTNTSATVANYAVMNPLDGVQYGAIKPVCTNGNLTATGGASTSNGVSTIALGSGKWYCEFTVGTISSVMWFGCQDTNGFTGNGSAYTSAGEIYCNGTLQGTYATFTTNDVIGCAFDITNNQVSFYKNGTQIGTTGTLGVTTKQYIVWTQINASGNLFNANFGQRPFAYTPPTGFVALNTFNLPTPTILQGNKYMDATLYTGTGATLAVTNAGAFKPDFVWIKDRTALKSNTLYNSSSGVEKVLFSNTTDAEVTVSGSLTAFNSNGFSLGTSTYSNVNADNFVAWQWQAGQGTTSSNTSGTVTSTVSVNTSAGFSIVTWAAQSTARTVGHGLGVAPSMIIMKDRSGAIQWYVYHVSIGAGKFLGLNTTSATTTNSTTFSTAPTSSVFDPGTGVITGNGFGNQVAYCFAEIAGFSRFTSYTGNGSSDGPFVYLGFRPKFVMIKSSAGVADDWTIIDTSRSTYNLCAATLKPNSSAAEDTNVGTTRANIDILSNGFKIRQPSDIININTGTYIVAAWAENPFKNSLAR